MEIKVLGNDTRSVALARYIEGAHSSGASFLILPIPSSRDGVRVAGCEALILDSLGELRDGDIAVGYGFSEDTEQLAARRGVILLDAALDDIFLEQNARLTAEGIIYELMKEGRAPSDRCIGIIGWGRIGRHLSKMLSALGAQTVVYTSRKNEGFLPYSELPFAEKKGIDILINTAPARIIGDECSGALESVRVIELASGNNFPEWLAHERYPSLPYRVFPESAARTFVDFFIRQVEDRRLLI